MIQHAADTENASDSWLAFWIVRPYNVTDLEAVEPQADQLYEHPSERFPSSQAA